MQRTSPTLTLAVLPKRLAICRLAPLEPVPEWVVACSFVSITRTEQELSIVCEEDSVPATATCERGWRCLRVEGPLAFSQTGVLASLSAPLAKAGIPIFVISTYDTDYVLVKETNLAATIKVLSQGGHMIAE